MREQEKRVGHGVEIQSPAFFFSLSLCDCVEVFVWNFRRFLIPSTTLSGLDPSSLHSHSMNEWRNEKSIWKEELEGKISKNESSEKRRLRKRIGGRSQEKELLKEKEEKERKKERGEIGPGPFPKLCGVNLLRLHWLLLRLSLLYSRTFLLSSSCFLSILTDFHSPSSSFLHSSPFFSVLLIPSPSGQCEWQQERNHWRQNPAREGLVFSSLFLLSLFLITLSRLFSNWVMRSERERGREEGEREMGRWDGEKEGPRKSWPGRKKAQILSSLGNQSLLQVYVYVLMGGSDGGSLWRLTEWLPFSFFLIPSLFLFIISSALAFVVPEKSSFYCSSPFPLFFLFSLFILPLSFSSLLIPETVSLLNRLSNCYCWH